MTVTITAKMEIDLDKIIPDEVKKKIEINGIDRKAESYLKNEAVQYFYDNSTINDFDIDY